MVTTQKKNPEVFIGGKTYKLADMKTRYAAEIITDTLMFFVGFPLFILGARIFFSTAPRSIESGVTSNFLAFPFILLSGLLPFLLIGFQLVKYQTTIGKKLLGIKILKKDESRINWDTVFSRELVGKFLSGFIFDIGYLAAFNDPGKQAWHDKRSGTYVVYEEKPTLSEKKIMLLKYLFLLIALLPVALWFFWMLIILGFFPEVRDMIFRNLPKLFNFLGMSGF